MKIYYPRLSTSDLGVVRLGGPGLANCMFFAAKAYVEANRNGGMIISPSWTKFSLGPILRRERDKRFYSRLFKTYGISGFSKMLLLAFNKIKPLFEASYGPYDMNGYFTELNKHHEFVKEYFKKIEKPETISILQNRDFDKTVAIHVRLGDYPENFRVPMKWYVEMVNKIQELHPELSFMVLSDGSDDELKELLSIKKVSREFFGNAYADMKAISRSKLLLASDSTFSAWGAFLGDVPIIFQKRHFPSVYNGRIPETIIPNSSTRVAVERFLSEVL